MGYPTVVLVDVTHSGRTFRIEREQRTGVQRYFVNDREVTVRAYLEAMAAAGQATTDRAWPQRIA